MTNSKNLIIDGQFVSSGALSLEPYLIYTWPSKLRTTDQRQNTKDLPGVCTTTYGQYKRQQCLRKQTPPPQEKKRKGAESLQQQPSPANATLSAERSDAPKTIYYFFFFFDFQEQKV